jgi:hemolysin III
MDIPFAKSPLLLDLEDRANSLTHAAGAGVFAAGLALIVVLASISGDPWKIVSVSIYGATLVLLYTISALYHSVKSPKVRRVFRILDHVSIHLLIAGTYTPFMLVSLRGPFGWSIFGLIWGLAAIGMAADIFFTGRFKLLSTALYLMMGWIIVIALRPLSHVLSTAGLALLFAGGGAYSLGAAFYLFDKRLPFGHMVWHIFVLGGSVCHYLSVTLGVLG